MYFITNSNNKYELAQDGLNVWEVKWTRENWYRIIKILIGSTKREGAKIFTISDSKLIVKSKEEVIKMIFEPGII